jgi:hypothetical protein
MPYIRTDAKTIGKIVERGNIDTPCTQIHDHSLFWLDTGPVIEISTCQKLNFFNDCYTLQNLRFLCFAMSKFCVQEIHITSNANIAL